MQIIPEYTNPLGVCTACRAARRQGERVVDLGAQLELLTTDYIPGQEFAILDGDWQLCETCVAEMGRLIGMETEEKSETLRAELRTAQDALVVAREELAMALDALAYRRKVQAVADRVFGEESA